MGRVGSSPEFHFNFGSGWCGSLTQWIEYSGQENWTHVQLWSVHEPSFRTLVQPSKTVSSACCLRSRKLRPVAQSRSVAPVYDVLQVIVGLLAFWSCSKPRMEAEPGRTFTYMASPEYHFPTSETYSSSSQ